MRTTITNAQAVVMYLSGSGCYVEDLENSPEWTDVRGVPVEGEGAAALTTESYRDTGFLMKFFRYNQADSYFVVWQLPHGWNRGSVRPHMHMIPMAAGAGTARFNWAYAWTNIGSEFVGASGWTSGSTSISLTVDDQYKHKIINFSNVPAPVGAGNSSILVFKMERDPATDTYTTGKSGGTASANLGILDLDLHYQQSRIGSKDLGGY